MTLEIMLVLHGGVLKDVAETQLLFLETSLEPLVIMVGASMSVDS